MPGENATQGKKEEGKAYSPEEPQVSQVELNVPSEEAQELVVELPNQDHCEWLLNVIQTQAKKMVKDQVSILEHAVAELQRHSSEKIRKLQDEVDALKQENIKKQKKLENFEHEQCQLKGAIRNLDGKKLTTLNSKIIPPIYK